MSRSGPPPSSTDASTTIENGPTPAPRQASPGGRSPRRSFGIRFAAFSRWLHIYLSMFGLASVLFFSVTGLTLNHPDWFLADLERIEEAEGEIDLALLDQDASASNLAESARPLSQELDVDRLMIVEYLRAEHDVRGALTEFSIDDYECFVTFKGPGYAADAMIDRETGRYHLTQSSFGLVAVLNDLHKGRDTGPAWSVVIDVSAVILTIISLSGLILLFYLKLRRSPGLTVAVIGTAALVAVALVLVP